MSPGYALNIHWLHEAIAPWLPNNPEKNELVRPNQETVQLLSQLLAHGFECELTFNIWRVSHIPNKDVFQLIPSIEYQGANFDARNFNPDNRVAQYCKDREITWQEADGMDEAVAKQVLRNLRENADMTPNLGLYTAIEDALSRMQRERIDSQTPDACAASKATGRL